jgi:SNF2-related domain
MYNFHGETRAKTCEVLTDQDIVFTTYHTLASDWKGHRVLQDIRWFRVVLDEGKLTTPTGANERLLAFQLPPKNCQEISLMRQHIGFEINPLSYSKPLRASRLRGDGA